MNSSNEASTLRSIAMQWLLFILTENSNQKKKKKKKNGLFIPNF